MNFAEHYFSEKKKSTKKKNKKKRKGGYNHASFFNSKTYDKNLHGTLATGL